MTDSTAKKRQLAFNIIEFLRVSCQDGTVKEDDKESLEVAISCIGESFGVDPDSASEKSQYSLAPASLLSLLDVYLKTKAKSSSGPSSTPAPAPAAPAPAASSSGSSDADKAKAEALKATGNSQMSQRLYDSAITSYTSAIELVPNPVYYSNRAAAWSALGEHEKAADDSQSAIDIDPKFVKAYSRLGHARFSLGDWEGAVQAYEDGLEIDPENGTMKNSLATAKAKAKEEGGVVGGSGSRSAGGADESNPLAGLAGLMGGAGGRGGGAGGAGGMPDLSALAGMFGGGGAGRGGGGGMPDLASLMNNPQMMAMAQQMMGNGGLDRLMQNPNIRRMAEQMQSGGGMPDLSQLANDPEMKDMAQQFMGGGGGAGGSGGGGR